MPQANTSRPRREDGSPSNWDRYLDLLIRCEVPGKFRQWYIRRVEDFLKDLKPAALSALTADQVSAYLRRMSARSDLADWQMYPTSLAPFLRGTACRTRTPASSRHCKWSSSGYP